MTTKSKTKDTRSVLAKVIGAVLCVVLIPILVVNLTLIIKSFVHPDEVPGFMGYKPFIVLSGSMEPVFYPGDLVVVKEQPAESLERGDIIAFREGESVTTHRVQTVSAQEGQVQYITKGDNNNTEDKITVTDEMVEGVYLFRVSGLGNVAMFLQTPTGMLLFIALPLIAFILYDIFRRRYYERREKLVTMKLQEELAMMKQQLDTAQTDQNETPDQKTSSPAQL